MRWIEEAAAGVMVMAHLRLQASNRERFQVCCDRLAGQKRGLQVSFPRSEMNPTLQYRRYFSSQTLARGRSRHGRRFSMEFAGCFNVA